MAKDCHPDYKSVEVVCVCGHSFTTMSTVSSLKLDVCSKCHPFYTGQQKILDSAGRVERFNKRYNIKK